MSTNTLELIETKLLLKSYKYPRLAFNDYLYHYHKSCNQHRRWKCCRAYSYKCPAVLRTNMDMKKLIYIAVDHDHNHLNDNLEIFNLKMRIQGLYTSSAFKNHTMFKPKDGYAEIKFFNKDKPENNTLLELKNGCANINIDEEDKSEDISCNKLATFCAAINDFILLKPLDPVYDDEHEQLIIKKKSIKNINDFSFDFECPNTRTTRNTSKHKQIDTNNKKNDKTENSIKYSSFNNMIKTDNQAHKKILPKKQNLIVRKKEENHGKKNECTLLTNTDEEKNISTNNTNQKTNNKTINTCKGQNSLISNINKDINTLTSITNEEINTSTSNEYNKINILTTNSQTTKEKNSLIDNINRAKNIFTSNTHEEIITLTTKILTPNKKNSLTSNKNKDKNTLINNINIDENILTGNTHKEIITLTTNTHTPKEKHSLISNINKDENTLTSNINNGKNNLSSNKHEEITIPLTTNTHTHKEKHSLINNINIDKNILTSNTHEKIITLTTNDHTPKGKNSLISNINKDENILTSNINEDKNTLTSNTHKQINTSNTYMITRKKKYLSINNINKDKNPLTNNINKDENNLISNINKDENILTSNINEDKNTLTSNTHEEIITQTINDHNHKEKNSMISNINKDKNTLTNNINEYKNTLTNNTHKQINTSTTNMITRKKKYLSINNINKDKNSLTNNINKDENNLVSNINKDENILTSNINEDKNTLTSNTHEEIIIQTINDHNHKEKNSMISNINKDKNTLTNNINEYKNTLTNNTHKEINTSTTNMITRKKKYLSINNINKDKNPLTSNINKNENNLIGLMNKDENTLTRKTHDEIITLTTNDHNHNEKNSLISNINKDENTLTSYINIDKNTLTSNTHEEIITQTINDHTQKEKNSLISNINKDENTLTSYINKDKNGLTSNTHEEKVTLTTNDHTHKEKNSLISNISKDENTLINNINIDKNILTSNTHEEIITLTTNDHTPKEKNSLISNINKDENTLTSNTHEEIITLTTNDHTHKRKNALISNINKDKNILSSNINEDKNTLTSNTHEEIITLTTYDHTHKEKNSLISNINKDKNILTSNINEDKNTLTSNTHEEIITLTTYDHTHKEKNSLISNISKDENTLINNINIDKNILTSNTHEKIITLTTNDHTPKEKNSLISNINKDENTLTSNTYEEIIMLTTNDHTHKRKNALISNINKDKIILTSNINEDKNTLTSNTHEEIITQTINDHNHKEKNSLICNINKDKNILTSNINKDENTLTSYINKDKNGLTSNTHEEKITLTTNDHTHKEKNSLISNISKDENTLTSNINKDENALINIINIDMNNLTSNKHEEIITLTTNDHTLKEKNSVIRNINKDENIPTNNINKNKNTLTSNSHKKKNYSTTNMITRKKKYSLIGNINKNIFTSNIHKKKNTSTTNMLTRKKKYLPINNINKDKNTLTGNIINNKYILTRNNYKKKKTLTPNTFTHKRTLTINRQKKKNIKTTKKRNKKSTLITNARKKIIFSKQKKNTEKPTNQYAFEMKSKSIILTPTINSTATSLSPKIKTTHSTKSLVNKFNSIEDDSSISDSDSGYDHTDHDEEPYNMTNDFDSVQDNRILVYCKENWPTVLKKMRDPLIGIEVFETILFNKMYTQMMRQYNKTKLIVQKTNGRNLHWKLRFECLAYKMKRLVEGTRFDRNTRHVSIQNQNQMDITLCKNIGVGEKEKNAGIHKKGSTDLKNNITPEILKTPKLFQHSLYSENRNLTESVTEIKTIKSKENKTNIQMMVDLIKDIPRSTTVSILSSESLKSNKRNLTESDTCITKAKIMKTKHSSIPNFDHLDVHIPPETTVLSISPTPFYTEQNNLTQSDSGIQSKTIESSEPYLSLSNVDSPQVMTASRLSPNCSQYDITFEMNKSKVIESNEHSTLVSKNLCPKTGILTQYNPDIITESNVHIPPETTVLRISPTPFYTEQNNLTQSDSGIQSKTIESNEPYLPLSNVDSPQVMTASRLSPNCSQYNIAIEINKSKVIESREHTTLVSKNLCPKTGILTQYNPDIITESNVHIPPETTVLRIRPTPFYTGQNNLTQSDSGIQSKTIESSEPYLPLSNVDSPQVMTASRLSPNCSQYNIAIEMNKSKVIESREHTTLVSKNLCPKTGILTQYNSDITESNVRIPPETTVLRISPTPFYTEQNNVTQSDSGIQSKTIESNEPYLPLFNVDSPQVMTASRLSPNCSQYDIAFEMNKSKVIESNEHSTLVSKNLCPKTGILSQYNPDIITESNVHIPPETTVLRISPTAFYTEQNNLTQSDSGIQSKTIESSEPYLPLSNVDSPQVMTASRLSPNCSQYNIAIEINKSKVIESREHTTLVSKNLCPKTGILTQCNPEIITESNIIDAPSASIDMTPSVITTAGISSYSLSNQKTISTQYNTDIKKTKSPTYIDLTVGILPNMRASRLSPKTLEGQSSLTQRNTQIECYEPITPASIDLNVNNLPIMMNSKLSNEKNIFTQYNNSIKINSSTSMSTDLSSNIPTYSVSSLRVIKEYTLNNNPTPTKSKLARPIVEVYVVGKDAELTTLNPKRMKRLDWKSPISLMVVPQNVPINSSREKALLPIALKKASIRNVFTPSKYPMLNELLTKPIANRDKKNTFNTPFNIQMNAPLPDVVCESTQVTNKINYQETIQSNSSLNLHKAPHQMKPVPTAIPLPPSDIVYDYTDGV